jgi:release factor glutamine methyltransferase
VPDGFDAVIANLPYVAEHERASLQAEILDHEPAHALFAGRDGLRFVRPLIGQAAARARVSLLALEVGMGQARAVAALMRSAGLQRVRIERDLAGIERVVIGERERRAAVAHASARGPAPA